MSSTRLEVKQIKRTGKVHISTMFQAQLRRVYRRTLREISKVSFLERRSDTMYQILREYFASQLPPLEPIDRPIVDALQQHGIFTTTLAALDLPSTATVLSGTRQLLPELAQVSVPQKSNRKEFLIKATRQQLLKYPEIFLWGLEERLLNIVEHYLGLPPAYHGVYFRRDLANGVMNRTRLWHLDKEDRRMVKIIVYLSDVNEGKGPFQYLPSSLTPDIIQALGYDYGRVTDAMMQQVVPSSAWNSCLGMAGTVIFVDPARVFHRGKIPIDADRFTLFFDFSSRQPKHPYYCKSSFGAAELLNLSSRLSQRQIDCVFWSKKLATLYQRSHLYASPDKLHASPL